MSEVTDLNLLWCASLMQLADDFCKAYIVVVALSLFKLHSSAALPTYLSALGFEICIRENVSGTVCVCCKMLIKTFQFYTILLLY